MLAVRSSIAHIKTELAAIVVKMKKGMDAVQNTVIGLGEQSAVMFRTESIMTSRCVRFVNSPIE